MKITALKLRANPHVLFLPPQTWLKSLINEVKRKKKRKLKIICQVASMCGARINQIFFEKQKLSGLQKVVNCLINCATLVQKISKYFTKLKGKVGECMLISRFASKSEKFVKYLPPCIFTFVSGSSSHLGRLKIIAISCT